MSVHAIDSNSLIQNKILLKKEIKSPDTEKLLPEKEIKSPDTEKLLPEKEMKSTETEMKSTEKEIKLPEKEIKSILGGEGKRKVKGNDGCEPTRLRPYNVPWEISINIFIYIMNDICMKFTFIFFFFKFKNIVLNLN